MYPYPNQPYAAATTQPAMGIAAQIGLQVAPKLLGDLYNSGQVTAQEYQHILTHLQSYPGQQELIEKLNTTFGYGNVNQQSVESSVTGLLTHAASTIRQQMPQTPQPIYQQPMYQYGQQYQQPMYQYGQQQYYRPFYGYQQMNPYQPAQPVTAPGVRPIQSAYAPVTPMAPTPAQPYQAPGAQQPVAQPIQQDDVLLEIQASVDEENLYGEALIADSTVGIGSESEERWPPSAYIEPAKHQKISCGPMDAPLEEVNVTIPLYDEDQLAAAFTDPDVHEQFCPDKLHVTVVGWNKMVHLGVQGHNAATLLDECQNIYNASRDNVLKGIMAINKKIRGSGGTFGTVLERFLVGEINKIAPVVFSKIHADGEMKSLGGFDDFVDFEKIVKKNKDYANWKTPEDKCLLATTKILRAVYGRCFGSSRKLYLDKENETDRRAFITNPYLPYRYRGTPLYLVDPATQLTDDFINYVKELMQKYPTFLMPYRTIFHNLPIKDLEKDTEVLLEKGPVERILEKLFQVYGIVDIIDDSDFNTAIPRLLGMGYTNHLVLNRMS